jgi:hypothetical protein
MVQNVHRHLGAGKGDFCKATLTLNRENVKAARPASQVHGVDNY